MSIEIKTLKRKDYKKAAEYAVQGMNFDRYTDNRFFLKVYGQYFLNLEMERSTHVLAVYDDDFLAGLLLAEVYGGEKPYQTKGRHFFIRFIEFLMNFTIGDGQDSYYEANAEMLANYKKREDPDGEICFLAASPDYQGKGVGSALINELAHQEPGKTFFLYTDSNCTYQFYENREFQREEQRKVRIEIRGKQADLICFLYAIKFEPNP